MSNSQNNLSGLSECKRECSDGVEKIALVF